ncbi:D-alanyl-D-alanine carboxypeptidase [Pseudomaricurvus alkylphenolicus]|uniref:D-alanyl-D-alanine carboxypeptidase family protein n=1 Tax=Pseudomaricurvus alkylphenolicus TaxID=1306991 RepID=UPI0014200CB0|nr:D-alanyl-D-alanine carboxypeptidase family protein [Pseudomaricurvus alkylphenolicus]NIB41822.1 D-alanyl-D-alanine carboxypeptidase [Pseudomaricurvus alkylphenolicus]
MSTVSFVRPFLLLLIASLAFAAHARQVIIPAPPQLAASAYLLLDADTGKVLVEHESDTQLPPASLTKMMTSYIVSSEIESGSVSEDDQVNISVRAWKMGGSKMFIREGTQVAVKDLLRGVIIQSGNDASVALAEHVAGSEDAFVDVMNQQAALLGMDNTLFMNATGWPADGHLTTARDLALLARALINDYPEHYKIYAEKYFKYNGINQPNRNRLLFRDSSVDGLKTGHTEEAGYCLVSSAKKNGMRLVAVVMGTRSDEARAAESQKLLAYGFRYFQTHKVYSAGQELGESRVWSGTSEQVKLGIADDIYLTIPRGSVDDLQANLHVDEEIHAPFAKGHELGNLTVHLNDELLVDTPLVALSPVEEAGFFARLIDAIKLFLLSLFS